MSTNKIKLCAFADEASPLLDEQIIAMSENDISLLEIRVADKKSIQNISIEEAKDFRCRLDNAGIGVWSLGSPAGKIDINDDFSKEIETFKHMLECGAILDAKCIRLFSFYGTDAKPEYLGKVCDRLNTYVELCKPYGIVPCHENEKGIYGEDAVHCLEILKAVPGLKAVFDPANFVQANQNTLEAWDMLEEYVYYGHIKDADENGDVVPPGDGIGHIPEYLPKFVNKGCSVLTLEPHLRSFVGLDALEQEGAKSNVSKLTFANNRESFDYAVNSLKKIISGLGI